MSNEESIDTTGPDKELLGRRLFLQGMGKCQVLQSRRRYLEVPGSHLRPRQKPAPGSTGGVVTVAAGDTVGCGGGWINGGGGGWINRRYYGGGGAWVNGW